MHTLRRDQDVAQGAAYALGQRGAALVVLQPSRGVVARPSSTVREPFTAPMTASVAVRTLYFRHAPAPP
ncbi:MULTISPECIES: hypothetical protein [Streptomyces]|uniref:Uncharacterized protein n=1 Tax=Streptomyces flaveolus TaxID=67297 RepID=A0ABV3AP78_9ACTN|nr:MULTISPECIES: hypothetical protein [Streptomyces]KMS89893.1 hypothetical protein ACZ91_17945 [Streptomyces regensis]KOG74015.1 hypothetical protein ADK77_07440 [Streptomyces antibioticus]